MAVSETYNIQRVYVGSYMSNLLLPITEKPPGLIKAYVCMVRKIKHHDVDSSGIFAD